MGLTFRQKQFVERYLVLGNATRAAKEAGYSARTARQMGSENLTKPVIQEEIRRRVAELVMGADEALQRLAQIARGEWTSYLCSDGSVDLGRMLADGKGHLVKSVRRTPHGLAVEGHDMLAALVHIGKHLGLFVTRVEVRGGLNLSPDDAAEAVELVRQYRERMKQKGEVARA